jgi:hypothetical protein
MWKANFRIVDEKDYGMFLKVPVLHIIDGNVNLLLLLSSSSSSSSSLLLLLFAFLKRYLRRPVL